MNNSFLNNGAALTRVADPEPVVLVISGSGTVSLTKIPDPDLLVLSGTVFLSKVADPDLVVLVVSGSETAPQKRSVPKDTKV